MELAEKIVQYVQQNGQVTTSQLLNSIEAPQSTIFYQIKKLTASGQLVKVGKRPNVSYKLNQTPGTPKKFKIMNLQGRWL